MRLLVALVVSSLIIASEAGAHEVRPGYLELKQTSSDTFDVGWKVPARGENQRFGLYLRLPQECENITEPRGMFTGGAYIERWSIRHPDALVGSTIHIDGLRTTLTDVIVRIERLDGTMQVERLTPSNPSFVVEASASFGQVAGTYLALGVEHILGGIDHLLFVLALLLLVKGWKRVVGTITAFTVAHSITLAGATLGLVHVPGPPVEAIIALSIVFVATEIIRGKQGREGMSAKWPWIVAFIFGLLHGLGFAGALSEIGLPQQAIPLSLFFFNIGVEFGQLLFIGAVAVFVTAARPICIHLPRRVELVPPYVIGSMAMFWVIQRVAGF
ncbi:MAG: HupE/UreJ family protein [Planctomycetes bacterium]|nr:HupE/UreJ family protein [Planctomycetota bacterium]MCH7603085.1 HupE/UreJ family protein [Planctomycetota bacterium]